MQRARQRVLRLNLGDPPHIVNEARAELASALEELCGLVYSSPPSIIWHVICGAGEWNLK